MFLLQLSQSDCHSNLCKQHRNMFLIYHVIYIATPLKTVGFPKQALVFTCLQYKSFEYTVGKGEIARPNRFPNKSAFLHVCSKRLLNTTVAKGEIARHEQFLHFISPFPTVPYCLVENFTPFSSISKLSSANSFSSEESKI